MDCLNLGYPKSTGGWWWVNHHFPQSNTLFEGIRDTQCSAKQWQTHIPAPRLQLLMHSLSCTNTLCFAHRKCVAIAWLKGCQTLVFWVVLSWEHQRGQSRRVLPDSTLRMHRMQPTRPGAQPHALLGTGGLCMLPAGEAGTVAQVMTRPCPSTCLACTQNAHPHCLGLAKQHKVNHLMWEHLGPRALIRQDFLAEQRSSIIRRRFHGHLQVFIATGGGGSKKSRKSQLGRAGELRTASGTSTCSKKIFVVNYLHRLLSGLFQSHVQHRLIWKANTLNMCWILRAG